MADDARRDALVIFSHQLVWIYGHAPDWAEAHLLSVLGHDCEDERAFWSGFFWAGAFPGIRTLCPPEAVPAGDGADRA